ncbi:SRPBCC family protein [Chitinophaga horti]|uniref:SRPBCC family protein n=1 Tax=Chitinophaga horti TaxID=2920382 RepID=A0ABY6IY74_9BACT|nr:SRPBCC family protein [Chitinophaga horti]UYQ92329.1 SRPBCC family protein [Chitinophaga horti]
MTSTPLIVERTYKAPINRVWEALTNKDQMKAWYFDIEDFNLEKGHRFHFTGGDEKEQYLHECEVLEVNAPNKLRHSWTYPEHNDGYSVVTFELFEEGADKTRVQLRHEGLDSFPKDHPNFAVESFTEGWNYILGESLLKFVEAETIRKSISINANPEVIWDIVLHPNDQWGKAFGGGAFTETTWEPGANVTWTDVDGSIGAKGVVKEHRVQQYLQVDMIEEDPQAIDLGYSERFSLEKGADGVNQLTIEAGPLQKKYIDGHSGPWDEALKIMKELSESK